MAARSLAHFPEIAPKIDAGLLSLTDISLVNQFIKVPEAKKEAFLEVELTGKEDTQKEKPNAKYIIVTKNA